MQQNVVLFENNGYLTSLICTLVNITGKPIKNKALWNCLFNLQIKNSAKTLQNVFHYEKSLASF